MSEMRRRLFWKWLFRVTQVLAGIAAALAIYTTIESIRFAPGSTDKESTTEGDTLSKQTKAAEPKIRPRTFSRAHTNDHCQGTTRIKWKVKPSSGWKIDVSSVKGMVPHKSKKSEFGGISPITENGFTVNASVTNSGNCVRLFGSNVARDARGSIRIKVDYKEFRNQR